MSHNRSRHSHEGSGGANIISGVHGEQLYSGVLRAQLPSIPELRSTRAGVGPQDLLWTEIADEPQPIIVEEVRYLDPTSGIVGFWAHFGKNARAALREALPRIFVMGQVSPYDGESAFRGELQLADQSDIVPPAPASRYPRPDGYRQVWEQPDEPSDQG